MTILTIHDSLIPFKLYARLNFQNFTQLQIDKEMLMFLLTIVTFTVNLNCEFFFWIFT